MALSRVRYEQTVAGNRSFAVPFAYLRKEHVEVKADGVTIAFTWVDNQNILTNVAPVVGAVVLVKRVTPTDVQVDFTDGSTLTEKELDLAYLQNLYLAQERIDDAEDTMKIGDDGHWDARNRRIRDMADPVNAQDAVTKSYLENELQIISDLAAQLNASIAVAQGYAQDAADSADAAAAQVALAEAQVALAAAQSALAAGYVGDAADQVDLATAQAAIAAGHAADAAAQVSLAAAQVALAADHAADAAEAQAAAEAAEGGAIAVLDEINDKISTGELGSYPGVNVNDPINQDMRKAWAALSGTEPAPNGIFEDLTSPSGKGILTPGLGNSAGKRILQVNSASPARLEYTGTDWKYATHDDPFTLKNLNSDADGRPILLETVPFQEIGIVFGKLPGEYYVDPSTLAGGTVLAGYTKTGWARLKSIPYDSSDGQSNVYHDLMYGAIVGNNTSSFIGTGSDWFECIQEVTVEYTEDAAPTNRILRKFVRHVKGASDSSFYGDDWQPVGSGGGGSANLTDSELRLFIPSTANYFRELVTGTGLLNGKLSVGTNDSIEYINAGGKTAGANKEIFVGVREPGTAGTNMNKGLYVNGGAGSASGNIYLDTQYNISGAGFHRLTMSRVSPEVTTILSTQHTNSNTAKVSIQARSVADTSTASMLELWTTPHAGGATSTPGNTEYTKIGCGTTGDFSYGVTNGAASGYHSQANSTTKYAKAETLAYRSTGGTLIAGAVHGLHASERNIGFIPSTYEYYSKVFVSNNTSTSLGEVGTRSSESSNTPTVFETFTYGALHRSRVGVGNNIANGSFEVYGLELPAASNFTTAAKYSNGKQGHGISIFNNFANGVSIGIRLASRWSNASVNTAVGVLSSDHAGAPGETAGVAPLRFEQTLTAGGTTRVWTAANTTIGTDAQNPSTFDDPNKTLTTITRMGKNRKMVTIRQRTLVPDVNGIITITLPESYKNLISVAYVPDQPDLLEPSVSFAYIPDSFSMASGTSRSTVSLGFLEVDAGVVSIANSATDCAGLITLVLEE